MAWLRKLPDSRRYPAGLEWRLLRLMPHIFVAGTLLPALAAAIARLWPMTGSPQEVAATVKMVDIFAIGAVALHWTMVLLLTIACIIVWLMKGPAYVADAYPLPDKDDRAP